MFDVVFLSKLILAVVLGASALSVFFLGPGGEILFLADLSDNVLSLEKVEFIFQGSDVTKKKRKKERLVEGLDCLACTIFLFICTEFAVGICRDVVRN